jgi:hypothetical protein
MLIELAAGTTKSTITRRMSNGRNISGSKKGNGYVWLGLAVAAVRIDVVHSP